MKEDRNTDPTPIIEFSEVVLDLESASSPLTFALHEGEFAFLPIEGLALVALGIKKPYAGKIKVLGKTWGERSVRRAEIDRRRISYVSNSVRENAAEWMANLDVDENVLLGSLFDQGMENREAMEKIDYLASRLGFDKGIPSSRPDSTSIADLVRAQWVRAFLPSDLLLVILENPLEGAPRKSVGVFIEMINELLTDKVAIIWVEEEKPDFEKLGLIPQFEF